MNTFHLGVFVLGSALTCLWTLHTRRRHRNAGERSYSPGPKALPIIGNILDMPRSYEWLKAAEWQKVYGDVVYLENFGKPLVFLNSYEAAVDLLEKRSAIYSCRPRFVMANELQGWDWFLPLIPYGDKWRKRSSHLHRFLDPATVLKYADAQTQETHKLLLDLTRSPGEFFSHVRRTVGAIILKLTYGHEHKSGNDPLLALTEAAAREVSDGITPGAYLVDIIPWLKYIPSWMPGAEFQNIAKKGRALCHEMRNKPYANAKGKVLAGTARSSMTRDLVEAYSDSNSGEVKEEDVVIDAIGSIYLTGADTSVSAILTFVLAMTLYPEAQRSAQAEIDRVVGVDRLPTINDRASLPYVEALIKECLRWQPVTPLGVHTLTQDDEYKGHFMPKGATIAANQWLMLHDPAEYPDPESFRPERFLAVDENGASKSVQKDSTKIAFGFGRRICPGRHLALNTIFIAVSSILSTLTIARPTDEDGNAAEINVKYSSSIVSHPEPFKCDIRPRSKRSEALIKQAVEL